VIAQILQLNASCNNYIVKRGKAVYSCSCTHHDYAVMSGPLAVQQGHDCQQVADVQTVGCWIKPTIDCLRRAD